MHNPRTHLPTRAILRTVLVVSMFGVCDSATYTSAQSVAPEMPERILAASPATLPPSTNRQHSSSLQRPLPGRLVSAGESAESLASPSNLVWSKYLHWGRLSSIGLGIVTAIVGLWRWFHAGGKTHMNRPVEELGTIVLFGKLTARFVQCADRVVILVDTPQGIVKLTEVEDPSMVARIRQEFA